MHVQYSLLFDIGNSLRHGGAKEIHLERFVQALEDPSSGLTYSALTRVRKQDVEHLFVPGIISFMEKHGYEAEAEMVKMVRNWRRY